MMTIFSNPTRRLLSVLTAMGFVVASVSTIHAPSASAAGDCGGKQSGAIVDASCGRTSGGKVVGYDNPLPGTTWVKVEQYPDRVCQDRHGNPSYYAWIYGYRNGRQVTDLMYRCITQHLMDGASPTLADAKLIVPKPSLSSNFNGDFLTGAPVTFSFQNPGPLTEQVPNFAAYIQATPKSYLWDFGDGTTSTDAQPTHTYASKDLNPQHVAKVTVTVVYDAELLVQGADGPEDTDLGEVTVQGTLEKPITEVWSALTREAR